VASTSGTLAIASARSFDPGGRGEAGENDADLPLAIDGKPSTGWATDSYNDRRFGFKDGVGIIVVLDQSTDLGRLQVSSPTQGWAASVYVGNPSATTLADWGKPVAEHQAIDGDTSFDLAGHKGQAVLLWITDLGDGTPRARAEIDELVVHGE